MLTDILPSRSSGCCPEEMRSEAASAAAGKISISSSTTGLDCLNELCTLSRKVERDILGRKEEEVEEEKDPSEEQRKELQTMQERTFLLGDAGRGWGRLPSCPQDGIKKGGGVEEEDQDKVMARDHQDGKTVLLLSQCGLDQKGIFSSRSHAFLR